MALRFCYHKQNPGPKTNQELRTLHMTLAHEEYAAFLANGVRLNCMTQAMADGPFALTAADTTWLTQSQIPRKEGDIVHGYWTGPF